MSTAPIQPQEILESCWSSVYTGILKMWVLISARECLRDKTDELASEKESK